MTGKREEFRFLCVCGVIGQILWQKMLYSVDLSEVKLVAQA